MKVVGYAAFKVHPSVHCGPAVFNNALFQFFNNDLKMLNYTWLDLLSVVIVLKFTWLFKTIFCLMFLNEMSTPSFDLESSNIRCILLFNAAATTTDVNFSCVIAVEIYTFISFDGIHAVSTENEGSTNCSMLL
jgi:hypothetical protein